MRSGNNYSHTQPHPASAQPAARQEAIWEATTFLQHEICISPTKVDLSSILEQPCEDEIDFAEVKGQESVKRVLEIVAAVGHNVLMLSYICLYPTDKLIESAYRLETVTEAIGIRQFLESCTFSPSGSDLQNDDCFHEDQWTNVPFKRYKEL